MKFIFFFFICIYECFASKLNTKIPYNPSTFNTSIYINNSFEKPNNYEIKYPWITKFDNQTINNSLMDYVSFENQRYNGKKVNANNNNLNKLPVMTYKEDGDIITYKIITPPLPGYCSEDDVKIFITNNQINLKIVGSGNAMNKYIRVPSLKISKMRNLINFRSRDYEVWFNLKERMVNGTAPAIQKVKRNDNSFKIVISFNKAYVDPLSNFNYGVPTLLTNATKDYYFYDMLHTKIPKSPVYTHRLIRQPQFNSTDLEKKDSNRAFQIMTVNSDALYNNAVNSIEQVDSGFMKNNTERLWNKLNPFEKRGSLINIDHINNDLLSNGLSHIIGDEALKYFEGVPNEKIYREGHDMIYYEMLNNIDKFNKPSIDPITNSMIKEHQINGLDLLG